MANELKVKIGADNKSLKDTLNDSSRSLKNFGGVVAGIGLGIGASIFASASSAISGFVGGAIEEFEEAQRTITSFKQTLEAAGRSDVFDRLITKSNDLQKQFSYLDNDDITASFQKIIQFGGLTEQQINKLLPVIIDLNAKQRLAGDVNKTVASTTEQVVKALAGQGRELKSYGVEVKAANSQTENLNIILGTLGEKVQGAADAFGNSLEGKIASTTQKVKDLQEQLGEKLLPAKAALIDFALSSANAFESFFQQLNGTYETVVKTKNELNKLANIKSAANEFAEGLSDNIGERTDEEFNKLVAFYDKKIDFFSKRLADKLTSAPGSSAANFPDLNDEIQKNRDIVDALKEQRRLSIDKSTIGKKTTVDTENENKSRKKTVDLLKDQIKALESLRREAGLTASEEIKLAGLKIQLLERDGLKEGLNQGQIERLRGNIKSELEDLLSRRFIEVKIPVSFAPTVVEIDTKANSAELEAGIARMVSRLEAAGKEAGDKLRQKLQEPLDALNNSIKSVVSDSISSIGESIGDAFSGENPVAGFITVIASALQQLGKALITYAVAKKLALSAITKLDPSVALAAGIAAVAAGALLRKQLATPPRLADGAIVDRPTLAMIGEGGREAVIPLNKLGSLVGNREAFNGQVEFTISGTTLRGVLSRAETKYKRVGG